MKWETHLQKQQHKCLVNNLCLIKMMSKKENRVHKAKKEPDYSKEQSLWIAKSKYNLKDGKSVWNN